ALAVGRECAARQPQHCMEVAILREDFEHLASLVGEKAVIWQYDCSTTAGLEDGQYVLHEVELLVARRDGEVFALRGLVRAPSAEGGIGEHYVDPARALGWIVDRVAEVDLGFQLVEVEVHERQPAGRWVDVLTEIGFRPNAAGFAALQRA